MRETRLERWHGPHHDSKASALSLTRKGSNPSYTVSTDTVTGTGFKTMSNTGDATVKDLVFDGKAREVG